MSKCEGMPVSDDVIKLRGVRTHNLKNVDVDIPMGKWTAVTGVSGSGKSSLVFDTLFAEAQRRFLETLGTYERQFMQGLPQGEFDEIENVPAAVALKQTNRTGDPRSLIGTTSDVLEPLRILFISLMEPSCSKCGNGVDIHSANDLFEFVDAQKSCEAVLVSVPFVFPADAKKRVEVAKTLLLEGYFRLLHGTSVVDLEDAIAAKSLGSLEDAQTEIILDRVSPSAGEDEVRNRVETLWSQVRFSPRFAKLHARLMTSEDGVEKTHRAFHVQPHCDTCGSATNVIQAGDLDWQSVLGACTTCKGLGNVPIIDASKVIPNPSLSVADDALKPWSSETFAWAKNDLVKILKASGFSTTEPYERLPDDVKAWIWTGEDPKSRLKKGKGTFCSINNWFAALEAERYKKNSRILLAKYRRYVLCEDCRGTRMGPAGRNARCEGVAYHELMNNELRHTGAWVAALPAKKKFAKRLDALGEIFEEAQGKLLLLERLGLGTSALSRRCRSLSGGEYQRVLLTRVIGNGLTDALYVLDEPSVGLGKDEIPELIRCIQELRDLGNTVVMVEHDPSLIQKADFVVELGPGGGTQGGHRIPLEKGQPPASVVVDFSRLGKGHGARGRKAVDAKTKVFGSAAVVLEGFSFLNCKNLMVEFPLGQLTVVTGPSGAGKTTLVQGGLEAALELYEDASQTANATEDLDEKRGTWKALKVPKGFLDSTQIVSVEQKAMHRTITSVPATVLGLMDALRKQFAQSDAAKMARFTASDFSFNGAGGCPTCGGKGMVKDDLFFLGEVDKQCADCGGTRYRKDVLEAHWRDKSIAQWLGTSMAECYEALKSVPGFAKPLLLALRLGLGHLPLGVATSSMSGGEAQRLRICAALSKSSLPMFCILDEPTRGLSEKDTAELLEALLGLAVEGHTFVVVEHHEGFQACAHQLVCLGPSGGAEGGRIVNREVV